MAKVLTTGTPWRVILAFAVPLLVGNVVQQLYQVADAFIVGRELGVDALAAVGSTGALLFLLLGFAWGMTSGFAIPTAHAFGAGDHRAVARSVVAGTILTGAASLLITAVALTVVGPAIGWLRTPEELVPQAVTFATVSFAGGVATMFFNFLSAIIRAIGDSRTPLFFLAVCCVLNVGLVLLFVKYLHTGVAGAAFATVLAQAASVGMCLWYIRRSVPVLHVRREDWRIDRGDLARHLRLGLPMGFQASIIAIGMIAVQVRLNELGTDAVAAFTAAGRVDGLAVAFLASLGLAVATFVAQNHGGGRPDRIRTGVLQGVGIALVAAVVLAALLIGFGAQIVTLFVGPDEQVVTSMAAQYLTVNGALYVLLGVLFVLRNALQGLGQTFVPTLAGIIELGLRVAVAIVLGGLYGYVGVVWSNPLAWVGAVVLLVPSYIRAHRALGRRPVTGGPGVATTTVFVVEGSGTPGVGGTVADVADVVDLDDVGATLRPPADDPDPVPVVPRDTTTPVC